MRRLFACSAALSIAFAASAAHAQYAPPSGQPLLGMPEAYSQPSAIHAPSYAPPSYANAPYGYAQPQPSPYAATPTAPPPGRYAWSAPPVAPAPQPQPEQVPAGGSNFFDAPSVWGGEAGACGECEVPCAAPCCCTWFGSFAGLYMGRDRANDFWTSSDANNNFDQLMNTNDADTTFRGGGEVRFGRYFGGPGGGIGGPAPGCCGGGCGGCAIEAVYWTLDPFAGYANVNNANTGLFYNTPINLDGVTIGGLAASDYFDGALSHSLWRNDYLQNFELNFWYLPMMAPAQRFQVNWFVGARYFRFSESLLFGTVSGDPGIFGQQAFLDTGVVNNLIGGQVGARANYFLCPTWSLYAQPAFGVFGNQMNKRMRLYNEQGQGGFDLTGDLNDVSLLGQLDLGVQWYFWRRFSAFAAYRVIGVTGIALADNQIPPYLIDTPVIQTVASNGSLILSGGVFGIAFCY